MLDEQFKTTFATKPKAVSLELQREVEQFLYWEVKLLTDRRYREWFSLLAEDIRYWMPIRSTKIMREVAQEYTDEDSFAHFDDNWHTMKGRIRIASGGRHRRRVDREWLACAVCADHRPCSETASRTPQSRS